MKAYFQLFFQSNDFEKRIVDDFLQIYVGAQSVDSVGTFSKTLLQLNSTLEAIYLKQFRLHSKTNRHLDKRIKLASCTNVRPSHLT